MSICTLVSVINPDAFPGDLLMTATLTPASVVDLAFAGSDLTVTAVCQCGNPISREDLRVENFGTDAEPCYKPVSCCSHDDYDAATPDAIDLDRLWAWHVKLGIKAAEANLADRIRWMQRELNVHTASFLADNGIEE
jgi:hypothetical protein